METRIHTLQDLEKWHFDGTALAVIGAPIKHSLSPQMHNAALQKLSESDNRFENWRYFSFHIEPEDLAVALKLFHAKHFLGLNLTIPHKITVLPFLTRIDPAAQLIGAANTLIREKDGYAGYNTDGYGFQKAVEESFCTSLASENVILLGAGGAAQAAAVQALQQNSKSLWIGNRSPERLDTLFSILGTMTEAKGKLHRFQLPLLPEDIPLDALVVNATSLGLKAEDPSPVTWHFSSEAKAFDMIYKNTRFLREARSQGSMAADGLSMLLYQGVRALEIWTKASVPIETMRQALNEAAHR